MARYLFAALLLVHGSIHLMGFLKAFSLARLDELELNISRAAGMGWLVAAILFFTATLLFLLSNEAWPFLALSGAVVSAVLIIISWKAAKYGMLPNALILTVAAMWFGMLRMTLENSDELQHLFSAHQYENTHKTEGASFIEDLPKPVARWIDRCGIADHPKINAVWARQALKMKFKPGQQQWIPAIAEQYAFVEPAAFIWKVKLEMSPFIQIRGRDIFSSEKTEMHINANGLFDVVKANGQNTAEGSLIRYLGEIVWYPSAALSKNTHWNPVDSNTAIATMRFGAMSADARFTFDELGRFKSLSTMRFMNENDQQRVEWTTEALEWERFEGIEVPSYIRVSWMLPEGKWTWLEVHVVEMKLNPEGKQQGLF